MTKHCPACDVELPYDGVKFCPECGAAIAPPESASADDQLRLALAWDGRRSLAGFNLAGRDLTAVKLVEADLRGVNFTRSTLSRADLRAANLERANLQWVDLHWADLSGANLHEADLLGSFLWYTRLPGARLSGANFLRASLRDAQLASCDLTWANFQWADLSFAHLQQANLGSANLRGADFSGADLTEAYLGPIDAAGSPAGSASDLQVRAIVRLTTVDRLHRAILPDGSRYAGFLDLPGDVDRAAKAGVTLADEEAAADFYQVSVDEYRAGRMWAAAHLNGA